jgi:AcrR family transcriptional regulator
MAAFNEVDEKAVAKPAPASGKVSKHTLKSEKTRALLLQAATKIVGQQGYANASVAAITIHAGVAQGTFYNYFSTRQELLDQLLPSIGNDMLLYIQKRMNESTDEMEAEALRFRAFFEYLNMVPEFLRILSEAEVFAPAGFHKHLDNITAGYVKILKRARAKGALYDLNDDEIEAAVHLLMGARGYLARRYAYADGEITEVPEYMYSAYIKLIENWLFRRS